MNSTGLSLKELIKIVINGKWIIVVSIILLLLCSVGYTMTGEPVYRAKTSLMIHSPNITDISTNNSVEALLQSLANVPKYTIEAYAKEVTNPFILKAVISELRLNQSVQDLANSITTSFVANTSIIEITMTGSDPVEVAAITNTLSQKFIAFVSEKNRQKMDESRKYLEQQTVVQKQKHDTAVEKLTDFLKKPSGPDELKNEIDSIMTQLSEGGAELNELIVKLSTEKAVVQQLKVELEATPQKLITNKTLLDDPSMGSLLNGSSATQKLGMTVSSEEINPVYLELSERYSVSNVKATKFQQEINSLSKSIEDLKKRLAELQPQYAEKLAAYNALDAEAKRAEQIYMDFFEKTEEVKIAGSASVGDANILQITPALAPDQPLSNHAKRTLAIGMFLGFIIGLTIVFFRHYWKLTTKSVFDKSNLDLGA